MSTKDLYSLGDVYSNILNGVRVVSEKVGPGDKELGDKGAAGLEKGGPSEKGGFKPGKLDPKDKKKKGKKKENKYDVGKFSDEADEVVKESVQVLRESFSGGKRRADGLIAQIVQMGRDGHIGTLRNIVKEMNDTDKQSTVNLLVTLAENKHIPLYAECKAILKEAARFDKERKQYLLENSRKVSSMNLNRGMKKTSFDTLFEAVMGDGVDELDELGVESPAGEFDALGDELGDEVAEDTVTLTIDRATAQTLLDLLQTAVGGGLEDEGLEGDLGGDEFGGDDLSGDGAFGDEDEETIGHALHGAKAPDTGKQNKVSNLKPASGKATSKVTDKCGDDGEIGHALHGAKQPNMGKQNKVGNLKPGNGLFS